MNNSSMQLYMQMQEDIRQLQQFSEAEILMIENSFNIATRYWYDIENRLSSYSFKGKEEEIYFYKNIKSLFTSVMEYYCFRYKAILFRPAWGKVQISLYWINELKRIDRFYNRHREFYQYWRDGRTDKDAFYFSREAGDKPEQRSVRKKLNSFYDDIVAGILAYEEYRKYIEAALKKLLNDNEGKMISAQKATELDNFIFNN